MFRTFAAKAFTPEGKTLAVIAFLIAVPLFVIGTGYDPNAAIPSEPRPVVAELPTSCSMSAGVLTCHQG